VITRKRIAIAVAAPVGALAALAVLDLVTGGNSHFTRSVLEGGGLHNLKDTFVRRYELAIQSTLRGRMPAIVAACGIAVAFAYRNRAWLYAPLAGDVVWRVAMVASLAGCVVGSLTNDSGGLLFVIGVFVLGCVTAYIQGDPRLAEADGGESLKGGLMFDSARAEPSPDPEGLLEAGRPLRPAGAPTAGAGAT
jgi:hypothetical protein